LSKLAEASNSETKRQQPETPVHKLKKGLNTSEGQKKHNKNQTTSKKLEARKQVRAERAAIWKQLLESKPDEKYEDPRDVAAIRSAIANMGDYKLKTADDYIVPESERVDADKKRKEIILLNRSINCLKQVCLFLISNSMIGF
jgi:hypothetical protein